jgi:PIN domain nuclease of toxin-antitoxin system
MLGDPRLARHHRQHLDALPSQQRPSLSDISLWETALLVAKGRLILQEELESWLSVAASPAVVKRCPITPAIVAEMNRLPKNFHQDPADRLIVATARTLQIPLATKDRKILSAKLTKTW